VLIVLVKEAPFLRGQFGKYTAYKVVTVRQSNPMPEIPVSFMLNALYVAKLFAVDSDNGWTLLEQSGEEEYLTDAAEVLWEKAISKVGVEIGKLDDH
jgi:hypothetical protein